MARNYEMEKETFNINDRHLKREYVRPNRSLKEMRKKTFTVDDRFLKREHVLPADTFKKGDSLELLNDGMILEAEELIKKISKDTANGGARQRVFSKSVSVYSTDYGRLYIEVIYDSFTEKEIIIVLSRQEYESGNWKKDLDDEKLTEAYKYAVYVEAKDDESLPDWMRYGDGLDDTFNVSSKRELIDNLDALMIANADPDEIHYKVTRIASVSKDGEHNDIDLRDLPKKYEQLFESTKLRGRGVKEDYEFYKKPNGKIGVDKVLQTTRRSGRIMHGDTSLDQARGFAKKRIPFDQMSAIDKQAAQSAFDELKSNGTLDKVAKEFNTSPRADVVPKASGDVADVYYDDNKTGTPDERIDIMVSEDSTF